MKHDLWVTALSDDASVKCFCYSGCVTEHTHGFVGFKGDLKLQVVPGGQNVAEGRLVRAEAALSGLKKLFLF